MKDKTFDDLEKEAHQLFDMASKIDQCFMKKNTEAVKQVETQANEILKSIKPLAENLNSIISHVESQLDYIRGPNMQSRRDDLTKPYYEQYHKVMKKIDKLRKENKK